MSNETECAHIWIANGGDGGEPVFRESPMMWWEPRMHVKCSGCKGRAWMTKEEWENLPVDHPDETRATLHLTEANCKEIRDSLPKDSSLRMTFVSVLAVIDAAKEVLKTSGKRSEG